MELFTREWGHGDRYAVLVHGVMSDSRNWRRVGPVLAERGYHVIAVDLRGHGHSRRAGEYSAELMAQDIVDTVPAEPELVMGHSLGGLTVSLAVERLRPQRVVYVDPAFSCPAANWFQLMLAPAFLRTLARQSAARIAKRNPRWDPADVAIEVESFRAFDRAAIPSVLAPSVMRAPTTMMVPSLVMLADNSHLVKPEVADGLRDAGFAVRVVEGSGHVINRDDHEGFMRALDGWI
ncbi:alpha/beta fold hydrolase [Leifsonia aquatica]|uniref:Hydrolase, alpha/beta domain protein n=2 Tax=Leifsonia aquatica TaxID=144185 RepID=U2RTR3_LEIAQ|nr:alpha/beta fold hydrolase [Leifsonia aquatica]ERK72171.1 hydrolase, alpha/beta domain protein [Leifsonia aquatica ATCC 14665]MBB2967037.1 pimeloyl-ACP methyl ester carboxylesterase [Leifsonia aquatica]